jgi:hypothetical protein
MRRQLQPPKGDSFTPEGLTWRQMKLAQGVGRARPSLSIMPLISRPAAGKGSRRSQVVMGSMALAEYQ